MSTSPALRPRKSVRGGCCNFRAQYPTFSAVTYRYHFALDCRCDILGLRFVRRST